MRRCAALVVVACAIVVLGCDRVPPAVCDRSAEGNPVVCYTDGKEENGVYMSSPWDGELLYFPGGMRYRLEHHLGEEPRWIVSYVSFSRWGTRDGGALAQAAGNQVLVLDVDKMPDAADEVDKMAITVANDSCADYWLLVTAGAGDRGAPP